MSIIDKSRLLNPLVLFHFEDDKLNLEGSESFSGGWVNGTPSFLSHNGVNYAISDGTFWGAFTGSGDISGDIALEAIMTFDQATYWARIFEFGDEVDYQDFINLGLRDVTGELLFYKRYRTSSSKNSTVTALSSEMPTAGAFFHVVANFHSSTGYVNLFIDGVEVSGNYRSSDSRGYTNSLNRFSIFSSTSFAFSNGTEEVFKGKLGMGAYYNRVLTDYEILDNYTAFIQGNELSIENKSIKPRSAVWAGRKSRDITVSEKPFYTQNYLKIVFENKLTTKQRGYSNNINKGKTRPMGYFESKVLIQDIPAPNRKVMCFTQYGQLLDETYSSNDGTYRFDHLLLDTKYLFVAHDNQTTPNTPPEYQAVAAGFQTATPYVEN